MCGAIFMVMKIYPLAAKTTTSPHLHDEFPSAWHPTLCQESVHWLFLLLGLLDLDEAGDGIDALPIFWGCLLLL